MSSDMPQLLEVIKHDREIYITFVKSIRKKYQILGSKESNKVNLNRIIDNQISLCDDLIRNSGQGIVQRLEKNWRELAHEGSVSVMDEEVFQSVTKDIQHLSTLLQQYKTLLQSQKTADNQELIVLSNEEKGLNRQIRRSFVYLLRTIIDSMKSKKQQRPLITDVIPAHNEEKYIQGTLRRVRNQTYPNKKIIVVDSASTDNTVNKIAPFGFEYIRLNEPGVGKARNAGALKAIQEGAQIIVFLDADSRMRPNLLEKVWEAVFIEAKVAGISKTRLNRKHLKAKIFNTLHHLNRVVWKVPHTFMFCTPDVFRQVQFWDSTALGEDVDWAHKVIKNFGLKKFKVITDSWLRTSARRFEKEGYLKTIVRWAQTWPFGMITGKKDDNYFDIKFDD